MPARKDKVSLRSNFSSPVDNAGRTTEPSAKPMTDAEFVEKFRTTLPANPLALLLEQAEICACKTNFENEAKALKAAGCSKSKFSKLASIGEGGRIAELCSRNLLSKSAGYSLLYAMSQLTPDQMETAIKDGVISQKATRRQVLAFREGRDPKSISNRKRCIKFVAIAPLDATDADHKQFREDFLKLCESRGYDLQ